MRSRDYRRWRRSADDLLWWLLRLGAIAEERPPGVTIETLREAAQPVSDVVGRGDLIESAIGELGESARRAQAALLEAGEPSGGPTD